MSNCQLTFSNIISILWFFSKCGILVPNNLTGTLPLELGHLIDVESIGFENQVGLRGSLPSSIGSMINLGSISILFAGPDFGGEIPDSLFNIPNLKHVSFQYNTGVWSFSELLKSDNILSPLLSLVIKSCGLSGTLPGFISKFKSIKEIVFEGNSLQGSIPSLFGDLTSIEYINAYNNQLSGTLPKALGSLSNATTIVLGKNEFHGSIPSSLGNLGKLRLLDLSYNKLEGSIPSSLSGLVGLEHISLQQNNLSGSIAVFAHLEHLSSLILASNEFNGSIPSGLFSNPTGNIFADFARNNFVGELPQNFAQIAAKKNISELMRFDFFLW